MAITIESSGYQTGYLNALSVTVNVSAVGQKIVVCVSNHPGRTVTGITDSIGNTYTKAVSESTYGEIWTAVSTGTNASNQISIAVSTWGAWCATAYVLSGALAANGATGVSNQGTGYPSVNITPQAIGSMILCAGYLYGDTSSPTPTANGTIDHSYTYSSARVWTERLTSLTTSTDQIAIGLTAPSASASVMVALEILSAQGATLEGDGSSSTSGSGALSTGIPLGASASSATVAVAAITTAILLAGASVSNCSGSGSVLDNPLSGSSVTTSSGTALMDSALIFEGSGLSESIGSGALTTQPAAGVDIESSGYYTGLALNPTTTTFSVGTGGRRILVSIGRDGYAVNSVTDTLGNTYTRVAERGGHSEIWTTWSYGSGTNAVTVHFSNYVHCAVTAYSLERASGQAPTNVSGADITSAVPTVDITPTAIRSRVFAAGWADSVSGTLTPTANATLDHVDVDESVGATSGDTSLYYPPSPASNDILVIFLQMTGSTPVDTTGARNTIQAEIVDYLESMSHGAALPSVTWCGPYIGEVPWAGGNAPAEAANYACSRAFAAGVPVQNWAGKSIMVVPDSSFSYPTTWKPNRTGGISNAISVSGYGTIGAGVSMPFAPISLPTHTPGGLSDVSIALHEFLHAYNYRPEAYGNGGSSHCYVATSVSGVPFEYSDASLAMFYQPNMSYVPMSRQDALGQMQVAAGMSTVYGARYGWLSGSHIRTLPSGGTVRLALKACDLYDSDNTSVRAITVPIPASNGKSYVLEYRKNAGITTVGDRAGIFCYLSSGNADAQVYELKLTTLDTDSRPIGMVPADGTIVLDSAMGVSLRVDSLDGTEAVISIGADIGSLTSDVRASWTEYLTATTENYTPITLGWSVGTADAANVSAVEILAQAQTHALSGATSSITGGVVSLSAQIQLVGDVAVGYGYGEGALDTDIQLAASGLSASVPVADLSVTASLEGSGASDTSGQGDLDTETLMLGSSASETLGTADLDTQIPLLGSSTSETSGTGDLETAIQMIGSAVATSSSEVALNAAIHHLEGTTTSQSSGTADLSSAIVLEASGLSESGTWGSSLTTSVPLAGSSEATSLVSGDLDALITMAANGLSETFGEVDLTDLALFGDGLSECLGLGTLGDHALSANGLSETYGAVALSTEIWLSGSVISESLANGLLVDGGMAASGRSQCVGTGDLFTIPRSKIWAQEEFEQGLPVLLTNILGWSAGKVVWENQSQNRPALSYLSLWAGGLKRLSPVTSSWIGPNPDGYSGNPEANPPLVGTEIREEHLVPSEFTLRVQAHSASVMGSQSADKLLRKVVNALDLSNTRYLLQQLGVVLVETGPVMSIPAMVETRFEGHAALDIRLRIVDGGSGVGTYISSAEATWVPIDPRME